MTTTPRPLDDVERDLATIRAKINNSFSPPDAWLDREQRLTDELSDMKNAIDLCYKPFCRNPINGCPTHDIH